MTAPAAAPPRAGGAPDWRQGWWRRAARIVPSRNYGLRPPGCRPTLALLHSISLPPGDYGGTAIEAFFTNRLDHALHPYFDAIRDVEVSAHFVIGRDGAVTQYVSVLDRAWHAGPSHWRGRDNCNDWSVGIELEGLEGDTFETAQYDALVPLLQALARDWGVVDVAGHEHVAPGRKIDPGPGFDWRRLAAALGWDAARFP